MEAAAAGNGFERGGGGGLELRQAAAGEMGGGEGREERWTMQRGQDGEKRAGIQNTHTTVATHVLR